MDTYGSSPRGRGTPEDAQQCGRHRPSPVHPRVGGEHSNLNSSDILLNGSSPRGRGTLIDGDQRRRQDRFIPAWAGNTLQCGSGCPVAPVHPRVGGEHTAIAKNTVCISGSSPRGRGTRQCSRAAGTAIRFIPAWAGNTSPSMRRGRYSPVHPRVGGEHRHIFTTHKGLDGSSPRGRGTLADPDGSGRNRRFIPAWAGNTCTWGFPLTLRTVHPRVGGEHEVVEQIAGEHNGSSPRGRGTLPACEAREQRVRFIPAWAGNTELSACASEESSVHPRVGGEHSSSPGLYQLPSGSSPRGRGTLVSLLV